MAAIISQQSKIVEQLRELSGMSSLIGLTCGVTFPTVVDFVDRSTAQLVSYVPRVTPILCQIIDEVRIPLADIAWVTAFLEEVDGDFHDSWGYSNYQAEWCLSVAESQGFPVSRRSEKLPDFKPFPTGFAPPRRRCVELKSSIPLYFDWNWVDRTNQLNRVIDRPALSFNQPQNLQSDGTGLASFRGFINLLEPAQAYEIDGASWEVASLSAEDKRPGPHDEWLPLLFRRDRYIYPRELWCTLRNQLSVVGELIPVGLEFFGRRLSVALRTRGAAYRYGDHVPAFPFSGSMNDYIVGTFKELFAEKPLLSYDLLTAFPGNEVILESVRKWLSQHVKDYGNHVFPTVTESIRDAGIDILLELPTSGCRLGFQIKGPSELARSGSTETVEAVIKRQIQESRQYSLFRLFLLFFPNPADRRSVERVRTVAAAIGRMNDEYVVLVPPEQLSARSHTAIS